MKKTISLILCLMLLLCGCTPGSNQGASNPSKGQEETTHNHTAAENRQADSFIVHEEKHAEATDYIICYEEPDGCITNVMAMGNYEQSFLIHNNLFYYVGNDHGTSICAIDFFGNAQKECSLSEMHSNGWLLYSDEKYIYGAAGDMTGNATYIFQADWDLSECKQIDAYPKQFRQFDYEKVSKDFADLCQTDISKIYVHGANVLFDANGMAYEMLIMVSAVSDSKTVSGNLLLSWHNQYPSYDTADMNPWFNEVTDGYGSTEGLLLLSDFLAQLKKIEDTSVIVGNLPSGTKPFRMTYGVGITDDLPVVDNAVEMYIDLTEDVPAVIQAPDITLNYFTIVSKENDTIIGVLNILAD